MKRVISSICVLLLLSQTQTFAAGPKPVSFEVKYEGGSLPLNQHDKLSVGIEPIQLSLVQGKQHILVPLKSIVEISYGSNEVHKRVGAATAAGVPLSILCLPCGLGLGAAILFSKTKKHYVGIVWSDKLNEGAPLSKGGAVFRAGKGDSSAFIAALEQNTGLKPIDADISGTDKTPPPSSEKNGAVDFERAIAYGSKFSSRSQFLEHGLKYSKIQLASAFAKDGISKYVTFFTDFEAVASAAAQAMQEMRAFTPSDAATLPLTGLIYANVEVHGRGDIPVQKVAKRYVKNSAHLVIQFDNEIVQPLSKELKGTADASFVLPIALFSWWDLGNVSLLTGGTLGFEGTKAELEFVFKLSPQQSKSKGTVILIDGDGNRHKEKVDFSKILQ